MAQPTWLTGTSTPHKSDTEWFRWVRILAGFRNEGLGTADEDPKRGDTVWVLKQKVLKCLNGDPFSGALTFTGSSLVLTDAQIAALAGTVDQSFNTWKTVNGHDLPSLISLVVQNNLLTTLDLQNCSALTGLTCQSNQLTSLNVASLTSLVTLQCQNNFITSLDVSHNTSLEVLYCSDNALTTLDVSALTGLKNLDCSANLMTSIDVSTNTILNSFLAYNQPITTVDISNNPLLTHVDFGGNPFTSPVVDDILNKLDAFGLSNGLVAMFATAPATGASAAARANLAGRGWNLQVDLV